MGDFCTSASKKPHFIEDFVLTLGCCIPRNATPTYRNATPFMNISFYIRPIKQFF